MTDGTLRAPISLDQNGTPVGPKFVWTGTRIEGAASTNACSNWSSTAPQGQVGRTDEMGEAWTDGDVKFGAKPCGTVAHLFCFEK